MTCGASGSALGEGDGDGDSDGGGGALGGVGDGLVVVVGGGLGCGVLTGTPLISNRPLALPISIAEPRSPSGAPIPHDAWRLPAIQLAAGTVLWIIVSPVVSSAIGER